MLYKWKTEFENWLQRPCIVLDGTPTQREKKLKEWKTGGLCITYDTLKLVNRLDKETNKIKKLTIYYTTHDKVVEEPEVEVSSDKFSEQHTLSQLANENETSKHSASFLYSICL